MKNKNRSIEVKSHAQSIQAIPWRLTDVFFILSPIVLYQIISSLVDQEQFKLWVQLRWIFFGLFLTLWTWIATILIAFRRAKLSFKFHSWRKLLKESGVAIGFYIVSMIVVSLVALGWIFIFGWPLQKENPFSSSSYYSHNLIFWTYTIYGILIGPITEEFCFRGMLYNFLRKRMSILFALILQAIGFGLIHRFNGMSDTLIVIYFGFIWALAYEWRKTIFVPILIHILHNSIVFAPAIFWVLMAGNAQFGIEGENTETGCRVLFVFNESGAKSAGLKPGDLISFIDGKSVYSTQDIRNVTHYLKPGDSITVGYFRDDVYYEIDLRLTKKLKSKSNFDAPEAPFWTLFFP